MGTLRIFVRDLFWHGFNRNSYRPAAVRAPNHTLTLSLDGKELPFAGHGNRLVVYREFEPVTPIEYLRLPGFDPNVPATDREGRADFRHILKIGPDLLGALPPVNVDALSASLDIPTGTAYVQSFAPGEWLFSPPSEPDAVMLKRSALPEAVGVVIELDKGEKAVLYLNGQEPVEIDGDGDHTLELVNTCAGQTSPDFGHYRMMFPTMPTDDFPTASQGVAPRIAGSLCGSGGGEHFPP